MDSVIFAANDGVKGVELWRLDSATGTPVLVKDINPGAGHSQIGNITKCGDHAFFTAYDGQSFGLYRRSEEHTSELQSLMRISYAVFCLKKKKNMKHIHSTYPHQSTRHKDK